MKKPVGSAADITSGPVAKKRRPIPDAMCEQCGGQRFYGAVGYVADSVFEADPFCSSTCARLAFGVPLGRPDERSLSGEQAMYAKEPARR